VSVWDEVVGQSQTVRTLSHAATHPDAMTHAWLLTGPPGSGRSTAARAFAAALQCPNHGCGTCRECRTAVEGTHADVRIVATEGLSIKVEDTRALVQEAGLRPSVGRLAGHRHRGRRPPHRTRRRRPAQGPRRAHAPHGLDPLRPLPRRRHRHDPVALPPRPPAHPARRGGGRVADPAGRHTGADGQVCRSGGAVPCGEGAPPGPRRGGA
jgi:hypothetical protein